MSRLRIKSGLGSVTMAKLVSILLCLSLCGAGAPGVPLQRSLLARLSGAAPQGILNLMPSASDGDTDCDLLTGSSLQERKINLDMKGDAGISTEELGQYSGYFKLARTHAANMFYFFFELRGNKMDNPVVLWMTGGPGCTSELALFYEHGPFKINDNISLAWNDYGLDKQAVPEVPLVLRNAAKAIEKISATMKLLKSL